MILALLVKRSTAHVRNSSSDAENGRLKGLSVKCKWAMQNLEFHQVL